MGSKGDNRASYEESGVEETETALLSGRVPQGSYGSRRVVEEVVMDVDVCTVRAARADSKW